MSTIPGNERNIGATYNPGFIVLSYFVSLVGAATTLELLHRRTSRKGLYNWYLLVTSSISMGAVGIWCMHFIGNRAIELDTGSANHGIVYSSAFTAASFFLPIAVLLGAFYLLGVVDKAGGWYVLFSGTLTGSAVCGMHYLGQLGIANYHTTYSIPYVVGALVIAIFASTVALFVFFRLRENWTNNWWKRVFCGCILAGAVSGMHWVATIGTTYRYRASYQTSSTQLSRTQTVIICTVLSFASCTVLLVISLVTNRTTKRSKSRAQQLVLACAYFDESGRIMVTPDGQLPTSKITDQYIERSFGDDEFSKSHSTFLWIFRATRNWSALKDIIPGMKEHLLLHGASKNFGTLGTASRSTVDDESDMSSDFSIIFKELFCVSAQELATQTHQPLERIGVLYEEPLETGTMPLSNAMKVAKLQKQTASEPERGGGDYYFGQGHFLFVVRQVNKQDAMRFGASGYRFAAVSQIVEAQSRSLQVSPDDLSVRFKSMRNYSATENLMERGVHIAAFMMRPNVTRKGFDVLVARDKSNQLPLRKTPMESLARWQLELLKQLDDYTVANTLKWFKGEHGRTVQYEAEFCKQMYHTMTELVEFIEDPAIMQAKFSAKPIMAPCQPYAQHNTPGKCTILSLRIITNIHARSPNDKLFYKPLRLFNAQQQVYAGLYDHESFARQIHREFFHCSDRRDNKSEISRTSLGMTSASSRYWPRRCRSSKEPETVAEKSLVSNAAFGGIMVSNHVSVEVSELAKDPSSESIELHDLGPHHADAGYAPEDVRTFVDDLYALFRV